MTEITGIVYDMTLRWLRDYWGINVQLYVTNCTFFYYDLTWILLGDYQKRTVKYSEMTLRHLRDYSEMPV